MSVPPRAIDDADKAQRAAEILNAAERLLEQDLERPPSVADVAKEAGMAKGTVYLYFASKEQLLLALHERHTKAFFTALEVRLTELPQAKVSDVFDVCWQNILESPTFMPLAALCLGQIKAVPKEQKDEFHERMAATLLVCGALLEQHFPRLTPQGGAGAALLMRSFSVIVGLWQLTQPDAEQNHCCPISEHIEVVSNDFKTELENTLNALWLGHMSPIPDNF